MLFPLLPGNDRSDDLKRKFQHSLHDAEDPALRSLWEKGGYRRITEIPRNIDGDGYESSRKDVPYERCLADDIVYGLERDDKDRQIYFIINKIDLTLTQRSS